MTPPRWAETSQFEVDLPHGLMYCHRDEENQPQFFERHPGTAGAAPAFPPRNVRLPDRGGNPDPNRRIFVFWRRLHLSLSALSGGGKAGAQPAARGGGPESQLLQTHCTRTETARGINLRVETRHDRRLAIDGGATWLGLISLNHCAAGCWNLAAPWCRCGGWSGK